MTEVKLVELDYVILEVLPNAGTTLGFVALAKQAKGIVKDLNAMLPEGAPKVTSSQVNGRLRVLKLGGLCTSVHVQPVSNGEGWQRTTAGVRLLAERDAEGGMTLPPDIHNNSQTEEVRHDH